MTDVEVGTALLAAAQISAAATYILLGEFGADSAITPAARQSWHLAGAEFGVGADALVFAVGVFLASLAVTATGRAVPRWVGWTGLALGVAQMTPFGFLASPVFLLWVAVAGVALAIRAPGGCARRDAHLDPDPGLTGRTDHASVRPMRQIAECLVSGG